ncbi:type II toxin-antitoxin system HicB family antitoxin [Halomarina ordinaria]|uniref:Type II toxin-antitoxin system HicB family antitoxin n=1 Tax=Halomarina ordinaria TaxID=3033939 RepID=A0ABD5UHR0_9EURY|nr:type II toxin-antitoxin system HicB family antitoxin [Halomarina sp. PSRA2]
MSTGREIRLVEEDNGWVGTDVSAGVTSQGETRNEALEQLDDAIAGVEGAGHEPTDNELRELGIDPDENRSRKESPDDVPDVLQ